jgi:hypothetical protein
MSRMTETLTEKQTARAHMRAGSGFETEASVTVTPMGLFAAGGLMAAILLSTAAIVRAARHRGPRREAPPPPRLIEHGEVRRLPASAPTGDA